MPRPSKPRLSRARIIDVATTLIDADGLAALSTRRLAAELGVRGPSLYNHFGTKGEILEAVADTIIGRVDLAMFDGREWTAAVRQWARSYRDVLAAHPHVVPVLARGPGRRPATLAMTDAVYGCLIEAGWPPARATHIGALLGFFVLGASVGSFAANFVDDPTLYGSQYPHLGDAYRLAERAVKVDHDAFELGLDSLLTGLVATRQAGDPASGRPR